MPISRSISASFAPKVFFFFQDTHFGFQNRSELKQYIVAIFKKEKRSLHSLNFIFCNDKALLKINQEYLAHDFYTDIITFELSSKGEPVEGEIYISVDRVRENARIHKTSFKSELHRVIFHGALHLCGYNDKKPGDSLKMRLKENDCLDSYFELL